MTTASRKVIYCFCLMILSASVAMAQPLRGLDRGFGVSPSYLSVEVRPGERTHAIMTLSNLGSKEAGIYAIEVSDLGQGELGAVTPVPHGLGARSCVDWIEVPAEVQIPAGKARKIKMPIRCPAGARGAYYAILNVTTAPTAVSDKDMIVAVQPAIGVTLEVKVPHPAPSHLEPQELFYKPGAGGRSPSLLMKVKNTGVWKKPLKGDILVYDRPARFPVRAAIPYKSTGNPYEVYPGQTISLSCPLPRRLKTGTHRVSVRLPLTEKAQARRAFDLEVPGQISGTATVAARVGEKSELDVDLFVEPPFIELTIPPGGQRTLAIRVRNDDNREVEISSDVTQARMEPNGMVTYPLVAQDETRNWLKVSPETFQLAPNRSTTVRAQVVIPNEGSHKMPLVGVVRLQAEVLGTEQRGEWSSGGEFPVIVVVHDPKVPQANLEIASLKVIRSTSEQNPSAAVLLVKNTGDKVARVEGLILFERAGGQEIARMDIGSSQPELILSGSEREFRMPLGPLDGGKFRVRAELSILGSKGSKKSAEATFANNVSGRF